MIRFYLANNPANVPVQMQGLTPTIFRGFRDLEALYNTSRSKPSLHNFRNLRKYLDINNLRKYLDINKGGSRTL